MLASATMRTAFAVRSAFNPEGLNIIQSNGEAATQDSPPRARPRSASMALEFISPVSGFMRMTIIIFAIAAAFSAGLRYSRRSASAGSSGPIRRRAASSRSRAAGCICWSSALPARRRSCCCTAPAAISGDARCARRPLAARYRVILVDRPGHGWSDRPGGSADASPARQAALIHQALERIGVTRAIVVGHSWSGALATAYALAYPRDVAGLVLLAPVTHPWPGGVGWYNPLLTTPVIGPLFAHTLALPLGKLLVGPGVKAVFAPQEPPEDYRKRAAAEMMLRPSELIANAEDLSAAQGVRHGAGAELRRHPGADRRHHRRHRQDGVAAHPCASDCRDAAARQADRAARHRPHAASRGRGHRDRRDR